ncbi:MAG: ATP-dependent Clp protease ATP-binding subunit [Candidatus Magasanikbacteria bacterium]|nr:ATP-dependent Clp protease ATP-binding subunit [Candidatus Magasanikbacteria bacterium]
MELADRFTNHLREVIAKAIQLTAELKNPAVEPIHLFFTLANQRGSVAAELLRRLNLNSKNLEQAILALPTIKGALPAPPPARGGTAELALSPLSAATKAILEHAMLVAHHHSHSYIGTEHLLTALLHQGDRAITEVLTLSQVNLADLQRQLEVLLNNVGQFPDLTDVTEVVNRLEGHFGGPEAAPPKNSAAAPKTEATEKKRPTALEFFATDLTSPAVQKNIDPVIGRDREIERVIQILCRRTKNNPLLLGEPGVGKTAIVEGLGKRILEGKVPEPLLNKKIYALDMGLLIAGTIYRGEFEGRLRQVIDEVVGNPNIILFIDEIHTVVGAGASQGALDAANLLKPPLARGQIRCIGATTPAEYKKQIEADAALERRFQPVLCPEPTVADTTAILRGIKTNYELYHEVTILDEALVAAARTADRYLTGKFLPDKAIDLLDETAAAKRLSAKMPAVKSKLWRLEQKLAEIVRAKESAAREDRFNEAVELKSQEEQLRGEVKTTAALAKNKKNKRYGTVTAHDVVAQVAKMIGAAPAELLVDEQEQLTTLEGRLRERIVGQDPVVHEVVALIRQAQLGLSAPDRPLASFLFVGDSGVGKTELAKTLAELLYPDRDAFIRLNLSEFSEAFSTAKILGSPAGYIGFKESTQFTDKIKLHPYCVILFDELDKAHADVVKLLLQMLENGELTDAAGKKITLRHAIIILTTTWGAEEVARGELGFGRAAAGATELQRRLTERLKERFSPEVINRIDKICWFRPLGEPELARIAAQELARLNERLQSYHTNVASTEAVREWLVRQLPAGAAGARDLRRLVRGEVEALMSELILERHLKPHYELTVERDHLAVR